MYTEVENCTLINFINNTGTITMKYFNNEYLKANKNEFVEPSAKAVGIKQL